MWKHFLKRLKIGKNSDNEFYLFRCNEQCEVVGDSLWDSIEMCMGVANSFHGGQIPWIKKE